MEKGAPKAGDAPKVEDILRGVTRGPHDPDIELAAQLSLAESGSEETLLQILRALVEDADKD